MPVYRKHFKVSSPERRTYNGVTYASLTEARYAQYLDGLVDATVLRWWIAQPTFRLGCPENKYRPDFLCVKNFTTVFVVDVKPARGDTAAFRKIKRLWKKYGPCPLVVARPKGTSWTHERIEGGT